MAFISRKIDVPLFLYIGDGIIEGIFEIIREENLYFKRPLVLSGRTTFEIAGKKVCGSLGRYCEVSHHLVEGEGWKEIKEVIEKKGIDLVVGVGGGKVIDIGKYASSQTHVNFLSIPTSPANDGISSPVAVISQNGEKMSVGAKMPVGVVCDLAIIRGAPRETILSGVGDLISNLSAIEDWTLAVKRGKGKLDTFAFILSKQAALSFIINTRDHSSETLSGEVLRSPAFLERLIEGLVMSGIAMEIAGSSRPCSGAEHLISHALDKILLRPLAHGIQVGIATIFTQRLRQKPWERIKEFFQKIGFPVSPAGVGIGKEEFLEACVLGPGLRSDRWTILSEKTPEELKRVYEEVYEYGLSLAAV